MKTTGREQLKAGLAWWVDSYYHSNATSVKCLAKCTVGFIIDEECAFSEEEMM